MENSDLKVIQLLPTYTLLEKYFLWKIVFADYETNSFLRRSESKLTKEKWEIIEKENF